MKLSLIIPCYNEALNIENLLKKAYGFRNINNVELILVNNGSTDNSDEIIEKNLPNYPFARKIMIAVNQGYGYGILQGLSAAKGDYLGWTHADLQTDPMDAIKALELIEKNNYKEIFVKGRRKNRKFFDLIFEYGMSFFCSLTLGKLLTDINAQPNIMSRNFYQKLNNPPHDFALDLYIYYMAKKLGVKIIRFPVNFGLRVAGEAHLKDIKAKIKYTIRTIKFTLKLI